jgi:DNA-binding transcriptional ArsR family regulator
MMLPLFRSQTQALVLTRLLLGPGEESLTDLALAVGAYKNAVKHEVDRLKAAGLVSSRPVGRSRLVRVSAEEPIRSIGPSAPKANRTRQPQVNWGRWSRRARSVAIVVDFCRNLAARPVSGSGTRRP